MMSYDVAKYVVQKLMREFLWSFETSLTGFMALLFHNYLKTLFVFTLPFGFTCRSDTGDRAICPLKRIQSCESFSGIGWLLKSNSKIETAFFSVNFNRLTRMFPGDKAGKGGLWFSGKKKCCLSAIQCCLSILIFRQNNHEV